MKSTNFYKILVIVLVILNVVTIAFFWFSRPPHPPFPPHGPGENPPPITAGFGLPEDAEKKIEALEREHHQQKRVLMDRDRELHQELFNHLEDDTKRDSLLTLINANIAETEKMTVEFFAKIASFCNEEQKEMLRERLRGAFLQVRPPKPGRP